MNTLYLGDCLNVLRDNVPDESVDLVYIDPPFNSKEQTAKASAGQHHLQNRTVERQEKTESNKAGDVRKMYMSTPVTDYGVSAKFNGKIEKVTVELK